MKWFFFGFRLCPMECYQYFGLLRVGKPLYLVLMLFWLVLVIFWLNDPRDFFFQKPGNLCQNQKFYSTDWFFFQKPGNFSKSQGFISNVWFFFQGLFYFQKAGIFCQRWVILAGVIMVARVVVLLPDNGSEWELEW